MAAKLLSYGQTRQRRKGVINVRLCLSLLFVSLMAIQVFVFLRHVQTHGNNSNSRNQKRNGRRGSMRSNHQQASVEPNTFTDYMRDDYEELMDAEVAPGKHTAALPKWIRDYFAWHRSMMVRYPGRKLFDDPSAPNVLIRVCLGLCGGLHDRLGQLAWDLYLANQTKRVLLMKWDRPKALENFLVPNELNWTLPIEDGFRDMHEVRAHKELFEDFLDDHPEKEFWDKSLDFSLKRATTGEFRDIKVLRHRLLGHLDEEQLEARLTALGETDMMHWTPSYGHLFHAMFKPSLGVQRELRAVSQELKLQPGRYSAVHCRVRHPKATPANVYIKGKSNAHPADKTGLPWYGENKDFAVEIATKAINCARTLFPNKKEPLYFFADSNDLVRYMAHELQDPLFLQGNMTVLRQNKVDRRAMRAVKPVHIVAREMSEENAHIDRQKGRPPEAYFATFVDLYLAINSRCVTYGIGYYALFATKISGTQCKLIYQEEAWGGKEGSKRAPTCTKDTYQHLTEQES